MVWKMIDRIFLFLFEKKTKKTFLLRKCKCRFAVLKNFLVAEVDENLAESFLGRLVSNSQVDGSDPE